MKGKIFNAQEVQAIIAGNKTMFREIIKKPLTHFDNIKINQDGEVSAYNKTTGWYEDLKNIKCPYKVGQEIFVKEAFNIFCGQVAYKTTITGNERYFWMPASRMKQEQSRITLRIKSVKVERLQDISEEDCTKEGFKTDYKILPNGIFKKDAIKFFIDDWDSTHKKQEHKWEANPWVFAYEFEVINNLTK